MVLGGREVEVCRTRTVVIGSGCAGLNAADWLYTLGERDLVLMTEGMNTGTSRNAGSDKQTYYKLSLCASEPDSVGDLAQALSGEGVHGDTALASAAGSAQAFFKLVQLGVPFPKNEYGEFVGYRTDHDPRRRASSAGPLTSKRMTEALERQVRAKGIEILDGVMAFELLVRDGRTAGVLALDLARNALFAVLCAHVVLCTGGPAALYRDSVYPLGHTGMSGMALAAGAKGANLHQWQYGLASTAFRWNVSGSYQQALPRCVSVDTSGHARECLADAFGDPLEAVWRCFLKGYEWPFDTRKVKGSSRVDLILHHERCALNRRTYLDFTRNPACLEDGLDALNSEALEYLRNCGAVLPTPMERLRAINAPAIALYQSHGIDLARDPLEIAVCAQHHNGGIAVDADWQSIVPGLYAAGEAAGTFGAYRPGGSALNAGQVGSMRAAEHIAWQSQTKPTALDSCAAWLAAELERPLPRLALLGDPEAAGDAWRRGMSENAAHIRNPAGMRGMLAEMARAPEAQGTPLPNTLPQDMAARLKLRDQWITQEAVLRAMLDAAEIWGSQGAGLVLEDGGEAVQARTPPRENKVLETRWTAEETVSELIPARPMPQGEQWFERAWANFKVRTER
jgi:succinate dehydrogenase/fumarate reductase flavoprotein subunit